MKYILILAAIILVSSCKKHKFAIKQNSTTYYTDYYTKDANGCIMFQSGCGKKVQHITICGNYIIIDRNIVGN